MFDSILKLVRPGRDDAPPTSMAIEKAIGEAQATLRQLGAQADALRARRVELVLEGDDKGLDALERDIVANTRRIEQAEALLVGLEDRHRAAVDREAAASVEADVAAAEALRGEYEALLATVAKTFEKAVPALQRMREIPEELRAIGFRLDQAGAPRPALAGHPNAVLRSGADPVEEIAVLPAVAEGGPGYSRDRNARWFRTVPTGPVGESVGDGRPVGLYDADGEPIQNRHAPVGAKL